MVIVPPSQAVKLNVEIAGRAFTVTLVVAEAVHEFELVTVTEYVPDIEPVALARVGLAPVAENILGPVHE
jgi:hypothetical protein